MKINLIKKIQDPCYHKIRNFETHIILTLNHQENTMASILIKDTTREQREQIVRESLGDEYDVGCGMI